MTMGILKHRGGRLFGRAPDCNSEVGSFRAGSNPARPTIPDVMYLLFERSVFLGAFVKRESAEHWKEAREKGGHGPLEIVEFRRYASS